MAGRKKRKHWYDGDVSGKKGISRPHPCPVYAQPRLGFAISSELKEKLLVAVDETLSNPDFAGSRTKAAGILVQMERLNVEVEKLSSDSQTISKIEITVTEEPFTETITDEHLTSPDQDTDPVPVPTEDSQQPPA